MKRLIDKIALEHDGTAEEFIRLLDNTDKETDDYLFAKSDRIRQEIYGKSVFIRGLIEFSNYCKNNCLYCGIRASNTNAERYRLTEEDILECCENGYRLGFRTFVMQSGEDLFFTDEILCDIISEIKKRYHDCAVTLSIGEKSPETYQAYYNAGADRYLLRHETATSAHYARLHPESMTLEARMECLQTLKKIGFQTGAGFMVGSPYQKRENLAADLMFLKSFKPHMIGIGPFIPQRDTPFGSFAAGTVRDTLVMLALTRLLLPNALIPATTALGTITPNGRELALRAGANVVMPNLSPARFRKLYALYDDKACTGDEAAESLRLMAEKVRSAGYEIVIDRGDFRA